VRIPERGSRDQDGSQVGGSENQMCCPLCEEPVRSVLFGLSAIGVVAIVRAVQKSVKQFLSRGSGRADSGNRTEVASPADNTP